MLMHYAAKILIVVVLFALSSQPSLYAQETPPTGADVTLLSAFFGLDNALPRAANGLCRGASGQDGMPVIFSHLINPDTLQAQDFAVTTESGVVSTPICATLSPALDVGELRTVLLVGEFGSVASDKPVRVEVVGDILTSDEAALNALGASVDVTPLSAGPSLVIAEQVLPVQWLLDLPAGRQQGTGCPSVGTVQIVRATWAGGVTKLNGDEADDVERALYRVTLRQSNGDDIEVIPFVLADIGDGDNNHLLCLDVAGTPQSVFFPSGYLYDPNHDTANPDTTVPIIRDANALMGVKNQRNVRYCEIIPVYREGVQFRAEVYNTLGLNDCPAEAWEALDGEVLAAELNAVSVNVNGPRYWVLDEIAATGGLTQAGQMASFGGIDMIQRAVLILRPQEMRSQAPYTPNTVQRDTNYIFYAGEFVYELVSPDGKVFVMQSYSQIVDPALTIEDLETLDTRLDLPPGWEYRARRLEQDLQLVAVAQTTVVQDDLLNTYQYMNDKP